MSAFEVVLSWRISAAGRHVPDRAQWGKTIVQEPERCLDTARSLYATEGCSQITLIVQDGPTFVPIAWWWAPQAAWGGR